MVGMGTIINVVAIIIGGLIGIFVGNHINQRIQDSLNIACGVSVLFIGISGTMEYMLSMKDGSIVSGRGMFIVVCLVLGALIGEIINIEGGFERFGAWLKLKTGNAKDKQFIEAFVNSSLTVCIGAMAIVGSIQDGILGDYTILATKAILDLIIIMVFACSLGKGAVFSAIPVGIFQGSITLLAQLIKPIMTTAALANLSLIGSILIFCVGVNLLWGRMVKVANLLPAVVIAVIFTFLPLGL